MPASNNPRILRVLPRDKELHRYYFVSESHGKRLPLLSEHQNRLPPMAG
jgi:hypothetical protein